MCNLENKNIDINKASLIGHGKNGNVYKFKNNAIKILSSNDALLVNATICRKLSNINTEAILLPRKLIYYNNKFSGYTLKLIRNNKPSLNICHLEKNTFIDSVKVLERDNVILSRKGVLLDGILPENVMITDKIYITDPSKYSFINEEFCEGLNRLNSYQIHLLLTKLILSSLKKENVSTNSLKKIRTILQDKDDNMLSSTFFNEIISDNKDIYDSCKRMINKR